MCVGLPARVVRLKDKNTAVVDASGAKREVSAALLETLVPGNYFILKYTLLLFDNNFSAHARFSLICLYRHLFDHHYITFVCPWLKNLLREMQLSLKTL